jgi:hypothetical protein
MHVLNINQYIFHKSLVKNRATKQAGKIPVLIKSIENTQVIKLIELLH